MEWPLMALWPPKFCENQSTESKVEMDTHPQHGDLISLFLRKENKLKIIFNALSENAGYFFATNYYLKEGK
jgi:hypothetical protein